MIILLPDVQQVTINDNTEYYFCGDIEVNDFDYRYFLSPGEYHVSHLEQFGARYIKTYDYNPY